MLGLQFYNGSAMDCLTVLSTVPDLKSKVIRFQYIDSVAHEIMAVLDQSQVYQEGESLLANSEMKESEILIARSSDGTGLSSFLMSCMDLRDTLVIAPITEHYFQNRSLFNISIPKGGTHLLYKLVEAFGYGAGVVHNNSPSPGNWYCVEYSNSHTVARDFFLDSVRRDSFALRDHPFSRNPVLFIYRNPLDVLLSEANYYSIEGATVFSSYFRGRTFDERVYTLLDDSGLIGSLRDRIIGFAAWLDFENVIPVSFEELVGDDGGGSDEMRNGLIWSLQLKLHVPGEPSRLAEKIFDKDSPTFNKGQIGSAKEQLPVKAYEMLANGNDDFMRLFGYMHAEADLYSTEDTSNRIKRWRECLTFSRRIDEFRRRPLLHSEELFLDTPYNVDWDFLGHNIVKYDRRYFAIPVSAGPTDLNDLRARDELNQLMWSSNLHELRLKIAKKV